ncbi:hypothetical protein GCM10023310_69680 [Paenibacillus vulneris]|uniref:Uncharacterized protein n=1 Tax=Paenibacillus vulneris TaxID=1133364 RepID=A0ABW3UH13_9BACL
MYINKSPPSVNYGNFELRGLVTGTFNEQRFYTEGEKNGVKWRRVQFGVKIYHNAFVYVELLGSKTPKFKLIYQDPITQKIDKNKQLLVDYEEIHKHKNYKIHMSVKANLDRNEPKDDELTSYEAAEYIRQNLREGDSVLIKGSLQITEYKEKPQEKYIINGIYLTDRIEFDSIGYEQQAYFTQEIVYVGLGYDEELDKHKIKANIIYKKDEQLDYIPYEFTIKNECFNELTEYFYHVPYGSVVKIHGHVNIYVPVKEIDGYVVVCGAPVKELVVTGGNANTLIKARYDENDFVMMRQSSPFKEAKMEQIEELLPF